MAKCDLSIELDQAKTLHLGGGKIAGVLRVNADKDVNCKGLEIKTVWRTHGRGNVAMGEADAQTVFAGQWRAGQQEEYPFELQIAEWPPSYHGGFLNIDHYVEARAKIPWGFDPKASEPFLMQPTCGLDGAKVAASGANQVAGKIGCIIGAVFACVFLCFGVLAVASGNLFFLPFLMVPVLIGGGIWFFRVFLPKRALGEVKCELVGEKFSPGEQIVGELYVRPKKNVSINGISMLFSAQEVCVSGSGSNRTTHRNPFFEKNELLQEATVLQAGVEHRFPINVALPADAPYSIDLSDNNVTWTTSLRVDIPRWPDWTKELKILVVPSGEPITPAAAAVPDESTTSAPSGGITFAETASHLWAVRDDADQVDALVAAVTGLSLNLEAYVERRLLYSGKEDPHVFDDGYAVWAKHTDPPLPLVLYVPHSLADEFEHAGRDLWSGRGTILGWDNDHRRLQIKLES